jgi:hypothetical protein
MHSETYFSTIEKLKEKGYKSTHPRILNLHIQAEINKQLENWDLKKNKDTEKLNKIYSLLNKMKYQYVYYHKKRT